MQAALHKKRLTSATIMSIRRALVASPVGMYMTQPQLLLLRQGDTRQMKLFPFPSQQQHRTASHSINHHSTDNIEIDVRVDVVGKEATLPARKPSVRDTESAISMVRVTVFTAQVHQHAHISYHAIVS